ncbi:magnesium-translocating P-type ATPase [Actinacidiphila guanduensis]|uniref:Magnesium-transporting ATPase, P-type 1 n=1 Tax=Actinacidiphila guanduensis TaxID=310781 RepID=A0A1H0BD76_9ACTN|nr:magnesium-translocating P-type ATPase [Actinacidiphila guanduensis]SDN43541.1 Mg2+-importing ATPase [Actinacidiphila guanduensis]
MSAATGRDTAERTRSAPSAGERSDLSRLAVLEVLRAVGSGPRGLLESQAEERLLRHGENVVPALRAVPWLRRVVRSLRDPFTAVLFCLALVSCLVAAWTTACVIAALVAVSCVLRASGEYRADRSAAALREMVAATATVRRRSDPDAAPVTREIPVDQLVPGDVVTLAPGDVVPADLRLLRAGGLTVDQALLTGESAPVPKLPVDVPGGNKENEESHLCFQGSSVASGSGTGVVVATGSRTRFAATIRGVAARREGTAFDRSVRGISWALIRFMLLTPPLVLMANAALRGRGLETVPFAVAVAVGLTPEMLPVIVTTALARGASRLARNARVIVKRLPALHDLGAVDVLCTDKTGTLTEDRPVVEYATDPDGTPAPDVLRWAALNSLWMLQLAEVPASDALDEALLAAAVASEDDLDCDAVAALPFDPARRLSTVVARAPGRPGTHILVAKGAPEAVLERCAAVRGGGGERLLDDRERARLLAAWAEQAADGLRVLAVAVAERPARKAPSAYSARDERGLVLLGTVALRDRTTDTAAGALAALAGRGVEVKVLTGDHAGTAARACRDLGVDPGRPVTGAEVDALTEPELVEAAGRTTVFARCSPEQKARVVRALRSAGHVTGFLGDGANDLPALRAADVGICPREAADVTRDAADVVLAAKDLTAIDEAITAGRASSANIASYLRIALSSNLGNVIAMLAAGLLMPFLPMLPAQVLLQNLCFDAAQLAFAYDRPAPSRLREPAVLRPRAFLRFVAAFGLLNAAADLAIFGVLALSVRGIGGNEEAFHAGWFTENLLTQALVMVLLRGGRAGTRMPRPLRYGTAALAVIGLLVPLSPFAGALGFTGLPVFFYALLAVVLTAYGLALQASQARYEEELAAAEQEPEPEGPQEEGQDGEGQAAAEEPAERVAVGAR